MKLVEREKLRVPRSRRRPTTRSTPATRSNRLFDELIADKLAISQILLLLEERPLSTGEISERWA